MQQETLVTQYYAQIVGLSERHGNYGPFIRVLLLFQKNFSVGPVFMTWLVFQSLLVDHIWMLLLLQRIFSEVPVLTLLYSIVDHLYGRFSCFRGLFLQVQDSTHNLLFKLSFIVLFFQLIRNQKLFRRSSVEHRTFSEDSE